MPSFDEAIKELRRLFKAERVQQELLDGLRDERSTGEQSEYEDRYARNLREATEDIRRYLENKLIRYPPHHHLKHFAELATFHAKHKYEQSVFIMTKFPEGKSELDSKLQQVIDTVAASIRDCGYEPRRATYGFHDWLWANVELYLLGCCKGVAIVEDRYKQELNPNVAFEWGWMKGMNKRVLFLMEEKFVQQRADWGGLLKEVFSWEKPQEAIPKAVKSFLKGDE